MPKELTQNTPADKSRRTFLSKFGVALALVAGVLTSGTNVLGRSTRKTNPSSKLPKDSIFRPRETSNTERS